MESWRGKGSEVGRVGEGRGEGCRGTGADSSATRDPGGSRGAVCIIQAARAEQGRLDGLRFGMGWMDGWMDWYGWSYGGSRQPGCPRHRDGDDDNHKDDKNGTWNNGRRRAGKQQASTRSSREASQQWMEGRMERQAEAAAEWVSIAAGGESPQGPTRPKKKK